jgi:hypothetical protein
MATAATCQHQFSTDHYLWCLRDGIPQPCLVPDVCPHRSVEEPAHPAWMPRAEWLAAVCSTTESIA